ncbi:MAG: hypothetical protein ABI047_04780 [Jatrophihabitantaceae bacterium]
MRRVALASTVAGLVTLLSFKTHPTSLASPPAAISTAVPGASSAAGSAGAPSSSGSASAGSGSSAPSSSSVNAASTTVTGDAIDTRFGPVQVTITVSSGKIASATAVE